MTHQLDADEALLARSGRAAEAAALAAPVRQQLDPLQEMMGLPGPVWDNLSASRLPDGRCVLFSGSSRCHATATTWGWIGCTAGEHIDRSGLCTPHAEAVSKYPELHCRRCWEALRVVSSAWFVKFEEIDDDTEAAVRGSEDLLP